jgi:dethiobiotin synthetase
MKHAYFITGTDTGVGKTWVSCALLRHLAKRHPKVVGMKPVAAGTLTPLGLGSSLPRAGERASAQHDNEDCIALRRASTTAVAHTLDNPYCFTQPISPHLAARAQNKRIDLQHIALCYQQLQALADAVVVEGAGGFLVPLTNTLTGADLAATLGLPVVLVVGLRLGCLNHALLTAQAIRASGLVMAGWVANRIDPDMSAQNDNIATLNHHLQSPLWADIAYEQTEVSWLPAAPC